MAQAVRGWVVGVAATATAQGMRDEGEGFRVGKVVQGGRFCLVWEDGGGDWEGDGEEGEGRRWILVGGGGCKGDGGGEEEGEGGLRRGVVTKVKGPVWDVEVAGEVWRVGVEWEVS